MLKIDVDFNDLFGAGGVLARINPGWELRPAQGEMAAAIQHALERNEQLVIEAGTGIGKSLSYLLPSALWAVQNNRRVIISTYSRALQEQLLNGEIPLVAAALADCGLPLRCALLMGADNYVCRQRLQKLRDKPEGVSEAGRELLERLMEWSLRASSGHRSSLPELVPQTLWDRIARDVDLCSGSGAYRDGCLWKLDRDKAEKAHVLIVNHALLLSGARLPPYDAIIIDEAHNLEEAALSRFGLSVGLERARALSTAVREAAHRDGDESLATVAREFLDEFTQYLDRIAVANGANQTDVEPLERLLDLPPPPLPDVVGALERELARKLVTEDQKEDSNMNLLHARTVQFVQDASELIDPTNTTTARWIVTTNGAPELRCAPLDVGQKLSEGLFSRDLPIVLTSATLSAGHGLKEFKSRVGIPHARELQLGSPFDYRTQAAVWFREDVLEPSADASSVESTAQACAEIVDRVPGGVFILFSSWKMLKQVHRVLREKISDRAVWAQGTAGNEALMRSFEQAGNAVLLGVDTFWQGVDIPGAALSCVIITKLPFPNVSSALEAARRRWFEENGKDYFWRWCLPKAVVKFRQGFGRLIRTMTDRGAVVCLDPRVGKRSYGESFLDALPPCQRISSLQELTDFFAAVSR